MNDISSRVAARAQPAPLAGLDSAQTPARAAIDTEVRQGMGLLGERQIAVGDGLSTQRLQGTSKAIWTHASPQVKAILAEILEMPADNGVLRLKQRQLGLGTGEAIA